MRRKDAGAVARMMKGLQLFHKDKSRTTARHFLQFCFGPKKLAQGWMATLDGLPVAFAITCDWMNFVRVSQQRTLHLLYIEDGFRRMGIGEALVRYVGAEGRAKGVGIFDTSASLHNKDANKFYQKLGFEKYGAYSQRYRVEGEAFVTLTKKRKR